MSKLTCLLIVFTLCCLAQPPDAQQFRTIVDDMSLLRVSITLDRTEYLPGEEIWATVTVANPTSKPIRGFDPFRSMETALFIQRRTADGEWEWSNSLLPRVAYVPKNMIEGRQVIDIAPGDRLTETVCLGDTDGGKLSIRHTPLGTLPAGEYRVAFSYERPGWAEFRVAAIETVSVEAIGLPSLEPLRDAISGVPRGCMGVVAAAFRKADFTTVLVASHPGGDVCWPARDGTALMNALGRYSRIAEIKDGVKSLSAVARADGSIELSATDERAYMHRFILPRPEITFDASGNRVLIWHDGVGRRRSTTYTNTVRKQP